MKFRARIHPDKDVFPPHQEGWSWALDVGSGERWGSTHVGGFELTYEAAEAAARKHVERYRAAEAEMDRQIQQTVYVDL